MRLVLSSEVQTVHTELIPGRPLILQQVGELWVLVDPSQPPPSPIIYSPRRLCGINEDY